MPGRTPGDDRDDRGDDRPALRRADAARDRLVAARRSPRAGTASASRKQMQRTREYVAVVRKALARERLEFDGETLTLPLPDGPGKALKLTISPVQERDPDLPRGDRPEQHAPGRRDRRRLDPDAVLARARRRVAPAARGGRRAQRPLARGLRHRADGLRRDHRRHRRRRATSMRPLARAVRRRHGLARAELLQRARPALRLRGRGARRSRTSTSTASATRRRRACPTSSSTRSRCAARPSTCATASRSTARPASARSASARWRSRATSASTSCA